MSPPLARLSGITRRFGSVTALDGASLEIRSGEVHGVLGANGAGKSTLLNVLGGMIQPDSGTVEVRGATTRLDSPRDAWGHGVALVHQHFTLVPALSVLENLALGRRFGGVDVEVSGRTLPLERIRDEALELGERTGLRVPLDRPVEGLGVGDRQRAEILKALLRGPDLLVLDEPTAVLAPSEVEGLFALLRALAEEGKGVVLVAHKLDEIRAIASTLTVLRGGRTVLSGPTGRWSPSELVEAMVGAEEVRSAGVAPSPVHDASTVPRPVVASLAGASVVTAVGAEALHEVSLELRRGEIVGVSGVEGNGQLELARLLAGRLRPSTGSAHLPPGIGFIPQDRVLEGVIPDFSLTENFALALHRDPSVRRGPWLDWDRLARRAEESRRAYGIEATGVDARVGTLSGGNQQRVVVAREVGVASDLLVAENPTRGLDVAATAFVRGRLRALAAAEDGPAVVLISTDLDEVLELSDRVFALSRGRLLPVPADQRTPRGVGALMLGGPDA